MTLASFASGMTGTGLHSNPDLFELVLLEELRPQADAFVSQLDEIKTVKVLSTFRIVPVNDFVNDDMAPLFVAGPVFRDVFPDQREVRVNARLREIKMFCSVADVTTQPHLTMNAKKVGELLAGDSPGRLQPITQMIAVLEKGIRMVKKFFFIPAGRSRDFEPFLPTLCS